MDVSDGFWKLREQILTCGSVSGSVSVSRLRAAVSLVEGTDLELLDADRRSELFRLKGSLLSSLSDPTSTAAFSTAVQVFRRKGRKGGFKDEI